MVFAPSKSRQRAKILNMDVSKTSDYIQIKIDMPNPSQEPANNSGFMRADGQTRGHYLCDVKTKEGTWFRTSDDKKPSRISTREVTKKATVILYFKQQIRKIPSAFSPNQLIKIESILYKNEKGIQENKTRTPELVSPCENQLLSWVKGCSCSFLSIFNDSTHSIMCVSILLLFAMVQ